MKKIYISGLLAVGFTLYACGGGTSKSSSNDTSSSAGSTKTEVSSAAAVDTDKPSDSKGIGEFKEVDIPESIDKDMAAKGKEIFQTKCTVCHQATEQKLIGPGLKGITKIRTPEWIMNMITDPNKMLENDPVAKALLAEFNGTRMTNQGVTKEQARQLYEFLRQNDAQ